MLPQFLVRLLRRFALERHPPPNSKHLQMLANLLRERITQTAHSSTHEPLSEWDLNRTQLRKACLENDPRCFTHWNIIRQTMFVGNSPYVRLELQALRRAPDWSSRWKAAVIEDAIGAPERSKFWLASSGNRIHHAYSLLNFEKKTSTKVSDLRLIVEFGGGYGSLCRLVFKLGFQGTYVIFDFPEFLALQEYYLGSLGIPFSFGGVGPDTQRVSGVYTIEDLSRLVRNAKAGCLIALWSLSESPMPLRYEVMKAASRFDSHLIALQDSFEGIENLSFARDFMRQRNDLSWQLEEIPHLPRNYYLMSSSQ